MREHAVFVRRILGIRMLTHGGSDYDEDLNHIASADLRGVEASE